MFDNLIINGFTKIVKFITLLNLDIILTEPQLKHIVAFMNDMILKGFNGKASDVADITSHRHRASVGRFLDKSPWQGQLVLKSLQEHVIKRIWNLSKTTVNPIYVIIDVLYLKKLFPCQRPKNQQINADFTNHTLRTK